MKAVVRNDVDVPFNEQAKTFCCLDCQAAMGNQIRGAVRRQGTAMSKGKSGPQPFLCPYCGSLYGVELKYEPHKSGTRWKFVYEVKRGVIANNSKHA